MGNNTIYFIIIIFVIIFVIKLFTIRKFEYLTQTSDEAIQNLASLYNKDQLTITNLTVPGSSILNELKATTGTITNGTITNLKTDKMQLGNKWLFSGIGDAYANDDWLRLYKTDGSNAYHGGLATGKLWTADGTINGRNIFAELDSLRNRLGWISGTKGGYKCADGWDLPGMPANVNSLDECESVCRSRFPGVAMCAMSRSNDSNDKRCYCKSIMAITPDGNWNSKLLN